MTQDTARQLWRAAVILRRRLTGGARIGDAVVMEVPETRFGRVGDDRVAYQVFGEGPPDLLYVSGEDAIDVRWEWPPYAHFLRRLAAFSRVIMFDQRGQGASDRVAREGVSVWEDWADDARAVLDAVGSERAALFAGMESTPIAVLFAATQPVRTQALILFCGTARFTTTDGYPVGIVPRRRRGNDHDRRRGLGHRSERVHRDSNPCR